MEPRLNDARGTVDHAPRLRLYGGCGGVRGGAHRRFRRCWRRHHRLGVIALVIFLASLRTG